MGTLISLARIFGGLFSPHRSDSAIPSGQSLDPHVLEMAEMISKLGHELRSPLSAIIGYGEMLTEQAKNGAFPAKEADKIQKMFAAGSYIERTLANSIAISAMHSGKMRSNPSRFELSEFLDDIGATGILLASKNNNLFLLTPADARQWVETDKERLGEIVRELVSNACRFTANGSITLTANVVAGSLAVSVRDTGIGITEGDLPRVFDRFIKIDSRNKAPFSASSPGLGLAFVREAASMLGGTVSVQSTFGSGSTFSVSIPL